jgi:secreted PhoX family phosphatase
MVEFTRRKLLAASVAATLGASVSGTAQEEDDTSRAPYVDGELKRFATTALGAEVTGPEVTPDGTLFFSLQHPSRKNPAPFDRGGVGYVRGYDVAGDAGFNELGVPTTNDQQGRVRVAAGEYEIIAQEGDNIGRNQDLAVPRTPDGVPIEEYPGSRYGNFGYNPDCNRFVSADDDGTEGFLFTNWEESPGSITRLPIRRTDGGGWEADLENAANLVNTEAFRSLGGTRINCYGDRSPWGTYLSAEEEYSHTRVAMTATVGDVAGDTAGPDHRGAAQFYNRPNPTGIQAAVEEYYGDDAWDVQGYWALAGVELQAYYLGADAVDETGDLARDTDHETAHRPIESPYPNPYRYGYIVDVRQPTAETPLPVKYHVMGRAAWECPDVQSDERTVYLSSDGANKGLYKFVADEPIPSYGDPMDVAGTLYAADVTNQQSAATRPPAEVPLEVEWLELGHATNAEVESWAAEYDGVDQTDYLEHADTDWGENLEQALEEADRAVVQNGNRSYIGDDEIVEWARQREENGPNGVDEALRRVPFLETRAAAKELGATVEFRKSEGVDSRDGAQPGDYVYFGISEVNDGMTDDEGQLRLDRVDGGLVYRARLESDYDVSTLEPVIVGPDATDPADVADDALVNVDNVFVLDDGRVLCCEDADQYGRSYPNDALYVYTPADAGAETTDGTATETRTGTDAETTETTTD